MVDYHKGHKMKRLSEKSQIVLMWIFIAIMLGCVFGCAKTATETAAETSLNQINVIEKKIKKECPAVNIEEEINTLRSSINTQLVMCETQKDTLKEKNNTLWAVLIGLVGMIIVFNWAKIKTRIFK